jgi:hypothetical protein
MGINEILAQVMALFDHLGLMTYVQAGVIILLAVALLRRILDRD